MKDLQVLSSSTGTTHGPTETPPVETSVPTRPSRDPIPTDIIAGITVATSLCLVFMLVTVVWLCRRKSSRGQQADKLPIEAAVPENGNGQEPVGSGMAGETKHVPPVRVPGFEETTGDVERTKWTGHNLRMGGGQEMGRN